MRADDPFDDPVTARAVIAADGTVTRWNKAAQRLLTATWHPGQRIVCTVTGNGLKDPDWAVAGAPQPVTVP
ncbi:threonine synthase, partial [Streptomyces hirsutus]